MANKQHSFGDKLRDLRIEHKLSQMKLAKQIGVGKSIISLWETNRCDPTLTKLILVAQFFDVSIDWLAGIEKS